MSTFIESIGTAVPENAIDQQDVLRFMLNAHGLTGSEARRLKVLYRATGIGKRYSVIPDYGRTGNYDFYPQTNDLEPFPDTKKRQQKYQQEAIKLSLKAAQKCLGSRDPSMITHLITVSCTGMYAPGLDIDLVHQLGLQPDIKRTAINFMGCYAAFNAIKVGDAFCSLDEPVHVLIVSTELCTLHFQKEPNADNLLSNALFGDGSAAALLTNQPTGKKSLLLQKTYATLAPGGRNEMAWNIGNNGFEMKLSGEVPDYLEKSLDQLLIHIGDQNREYDYFALHPGGKRILKVIEKALNINQEQNRHARSILRNYGNMSSSTILFVLQHILDEISAEDDGKKLLALAFGPGLTLESMIMTTCHE